MCPKRKRFAVEFRRILEVLRLEGFQIKFWTNVHDLCVQKRSCLQWSSHAFCKLSACTFYIKTSRYNFTIYASKNGAVCCVVQTLFGRFPLAKLIKVVGTFSRFMCRANKHYWLQDFVKILRPRFIILHAHRSLLVFLGTLWNSWVSHFIRMLWIWTHFNCECSHKLWRASVTLCEAISRKSWSGTSDMFWNIWTSKEWTDFVKFDLRYDAWQN